MKIWPYIRYLPLVSVIKNWLFLSTVFITVLTGEGLLLIIAQAMASILYLYWWGGFQQYTAYYDATASLPYHQIIEYYTQDAMMMLQGIVGSAVLIVSIVFWYTHDVIMLSFILLSIVMLLRAAQKAIKLRKYIRQIQLRG